jgi:hypothetical protein
MISNKIKLKFVDNKYAKSKQNGGDGSYPANDMKKRIKKCKYCKSYFDGVTCQKMWFEPLKYLFCSQCQNILSINTSSFSIYVNDVQRDLYNIYRELVKKNIAKIKNDNETGVYNGQPVNASKKGGTRLWRMIRFVTKYRVTDEILKNRIDCWIDKYNKEAEHFFNIIKAYSQEFVSAKKIYSRLIEHNKKNINTLRLLDDEETLVKIPCGNYAIYPLFTLKMKRRNRKDSRFVPKVRENPKFIKHSDFVKDLVSQTSAESKLSSNIVPHNRDVQNFFDSVCILFLESAEKSKTFIDTINKSQKKNNKSSIGYIDESDLSSDLPDSTSNENTPLIWVSKVYSIQSDLIDKLPIDRLKENDSNIVIPTKRSRKQSDMSDVPVLKNTVKRVRKTDSPRNNTKSRRKNNHSQKENLEINT